MSFAEQMREQTTKTYTENGAAARNTSGDARLDLFASIGSLRSADPERIELLFAEAYRADPLFALKILFYVRDIREVSARDVSFGFCCSTLPNIIRRMSLRISI